MAAIAEQAQQLAEFVKRVSADATRAAVAEALRSMQIAPTAVGTLLSHAKNILQLPPEIFSIDIMTFSGSLSAAAPPVVTQPSILRVPENMWAELESIHGYWEVPNTSPADIPLVTFNAKQAGGRRNMFSTDMNMAALITTSGPTAGIEFKRGAHLFPPGTDIDLDFSVATTYSATARKIGILFKVNLVHEQFLNC